VEYISRRKWEEKEKDEEALLFVSFSLIILPWYIYYFA